MSLLDTIIAEGAAGISALRHGAAWLVGASAEAQQDLATMERDNPLVAAAVTAGLGAAREHGIPTDQIATTAEDVLALAKEIAGPAQPAAPAPTPAAPSGSAGAEPETHPAA